MRRTFFTADCHFCHAGIIAMCNRPFSSIDEMNRALVAGWNAVVRPNDTIWCLGDFAHRAVDPARLRHLFNSLSGEKHLVSGNHDGADTLALPWASVAPVAEITVEGQRIFASHYAHRAWPEQRRGAWQLFGHTHGRLSGSSQSLDVGVDCWGYCPASIPQIRQRLATLPPPEAEGEVENHISNAITP
jgi:calcineurin-like phosphoesterase family protein